MYLVWLGSTVQQHNACRYHNNPWLSLPLFHLKRTPYQSQQQAHLWGWSKKLRWWAGIARSKPISILHAWQVTKSFNYNHLNFVKPPPPSLAITEENGHLFPRILCNLGYPKFPEGAEVPDFLHHVLLEEGVDEGILYRVAILRLHH